MGKLGRSIERLISIKNLSDEIGIDGAAQYFGMKPETVKRRLRDYAKYSNSEDGRTDGPILIMPDMHAPYHHPQALEFLKWVHEWRGCRRRIASVGDIWDFHSMSFHKNEPDALSPEEEYLKIREFSAELAEVFPEGDVVLGNHCLDKDTELLTQRGWVTYDEIDKADRVLSMINEDECDWFEIDEILIRKQTEPMKHLKTSTVDYMCTDKHRVLHYNKSTEPKLKYTLADSMNGIKAIPTGSLSRGVDDHNCWSERDIELGAWLLTDSGISGNGYITVYQSKVETIKNIKDLLDFQQIDYSELVRDRDIKSICGKTLRKKPLVAHEFHFNAESSRSWRCLMDDKRWIYDIPMVYWDTFIQTIIDADGSRPRNNNGSHVGTVYGNKEWLETLQIACVLHGMRANLKQDNRGHWLLRLTDNDVAWYNSNKVEDVEYNDDVWCLAVHHTNFMVRRGGTPFFTGNCDIPKRRMVDAGLAPSMLRNPNELYGLPDTWKIHPMYFVLEPESWDVLVEHGQGSAGKYGCANTAKEKRCSYVQGHTHSSAAVIPSTNHKNTIFGMNVGCLVDSSSLAMRYGKYTTRKGILGCGVVYSGSHAEFIPIQSWPGYEGE